MFNVEPCIVTVCLCLSPSPEYEPLYHSFLGAGNLVEPEIFLVEFN